MEAKVDRVQIKIRSNNYRGIIFIPSVRITSDWHFH